MSSMTPVPKASKAVALVTSDRLDEFASRVALVLELLSGAPKSDLAMALRREAESFGLTSAELARVLKYPSVRARVNAAREELVSSGRLFKLKSLAVAETLPDLAAQLVADPSTPAKVRAQMMDMVVKWAGLATQADDSSGGQAGRVVVNINLSEDRGVVISGGDPDGEG